MIFSLAPSLPPSLTYPSLTYWLTDSFAHLLTHAHSKSKSNGKSKTKSKSKRKRKRKSKSKSKSKKSLFIVGTL